MARANGVIETVVGGNSLTFKVVGQPDLVLDLTKVDSTMLDYAALHGFKQRVSDAAAIPADELTGKPASPSEKWAAMKVLVDHYNSGASEWRVAGTGEGRESGGVTLRAVAAVQGVSVEDMRERVNELAERKGLTTKAIYAQLAKSPDVIRKIAEMRAAKSNVDSNSLLEELNG